MASNDDLITGLMIKFARHEKLTDEEMRILEEWWQQSPEHQRLAEQFGDEEWVRAELARMKPAPMKEMWEGINQYLDDIGAPDDRDKPMEWEDEGPAEFPGRKWTRPFAVAAVLVLCVTSVWVLVGTGGRKTSSPVAAVSRPEPVATEDGVLLVGSDGGAIDVNAARVGDTVGRMGNVVVKKLDTNQLALYKVDEGAGVAADGWQAVLVGKKRSPYLVRLADGSNAWLDGGARFQYAVAGRTTADDFRLGGKAFFDVTKDKSRPFIVSMAGDRAVEVLGTSFNVDAGNEESRVALLNGAVRVRSGGDGAVLKPGQEAVLSAGKTEVRAMADSGAVTAWVKGSLYFHFDNTDFLEAMRTVASWYGYTISNPKGLRGIPITDRLRKDPTPEGVVSQMGEIENGFLYVRISNKIIYISDKRTAIDR